MSTESLLKLAMARFLSDDTRRSGRNDRMANGALALSVIMLSGALALAATLQAAPAVLTSEALVRHVERFNAMEDESIVNLVPNAEAAQWLKANIPLFECPEPDVEEIY